MLIRFYTTYDSFDLQWRRRKVDLTIFSCMQIIQVRVNRAEPSFTLVRLLLVYFTPCASYVVIYSKNAP